MQDYLLVNVTFDKVFEKGPFSVNLRFSSERGDQQ
jgi:hypothetical protein